MREPITIKAENTHMKKIITSVFIAAAMLGLTVSAMAQAIYAPVTLLSASDITNGVVGADTVHSAADWTSRVVDVRKASSFDLMLKGQPSVTETNTCWVYLQYSVDGVNYEPTWLRRIEVAMGAVGGTAYTAVTNVPAFGAGYVRLNATNHAAAGGLTNFTIQASMKLLYGK